MLALSEELGARLVGLMSDRVRDIARHDQQREKLAALGTLAAGIAHEVNNPAAAARRASTTLGKRLAAMPALTGRLARHGLTEAQVTADRCVRRRREWRATSPRRAPASRAWSAPIKAYSHLDRAQDKQLTDLRTGIDSTLVMLGHKVRQRGAGITQ